MLELECAEGKGIPRHLILVDSEDQWLVDRGGWVLCSGYARRRFWRANTSKFLYLHRILMRPRSGFHVDHFNGVKMDNRRCNLRIVTRSENMQNRRGAERGAVTQRRGVSFNRDVMRYDARLRVAGKQIYLGLFDSIEEADLTVQRARALLMTHSIESPHPVASREHLMEGPTPKTYTEILDAAFQFQA